MTKSGARTAANLVLGAAGLAAVYVVLTTPRLRRLAAVAAQWWLGASVPVYLMTEIRHAWLESADSA